MFICLEHRCYSPTMARSSELVGRFTRVHAIDRIGYISQETLNMDYMEGKLGAASLELPN